MVGDGKCVSLKDLMSNCPVLLYRTIAAVKYLGYRQDNLWIHNGFMYIGFKEMQSYRT